jgi:hypothetical protein
MAALALESGAQGRVYFTGGATAVLLGWRESTLDADIALDPESDVVLRAIPRLKESLQLNVELASPADFIPELPGWKERSLFVAQEGRLSFFHYDLYSQALSKVERGHAQDRRDLGEMLDRGLVTVARLRELFEAISPQLYRYPALDPASFRRSLEEALIGR